MLPSRNKCSRGVDPNVSADKLLLFVIIFVHHYYRSSECLSWESGTARSSIKDRPFYEFSQQQETAGVNCMAVSKRFHFHIHNARIRALSAMHFVSSQLRNLVLNQTMPLSLIFLFSHRTAAENFYYWYCLEKLLLDHFWEKRSWSRLKCNTWVTWCKRAGTIVCKILLKVFKLAFLCVPIALDMTALNLSSRKFASFRLCSFALND